MKLDLSGNHSDCVLIGTVIQFRNDKVINHFSQLVLIYNIFICRHSMHSTLDTAISKLLMYSILPTWCELISWVICIVICIMYSSSMFDMKTLTILDLDFNNIRDEGVQLLTNALQNNRVQFIENLHFSQIYILVSL
jgi:hypothetical protein